MRTILLVILPALTIAAAASEPQKIVFARVFPQPGQIGLFIAAADGSDERPLVAASDVDYDATWAPTARRSCSRPSATDPPTCIASSRMAAGSSG